ncbi:IclR family transcriptional regulator [Paraburkholderia sp. J67]|uniref:IclR family transcriptional regulator n=1 Tax=Paraburkholderia sp. J67 TaxID=2805435 RepID=UPI002ABDF46F|nr:IclR family transcriptional regulator [Paraburkholderia sp. J67]
MTVERGLEVLRAFRSSRAPLSNAELVRRTGLSKATVSRLTSTLIQSGFLRLVPGRREFELSIGALGIGHAYLATNELLQSAQPLMQELADRLDVSVALGIQDGIDMLYVDYRVSRKVATLRLGIGSVLPMSTTSIGRAYLWGLPEDAREPLIEEHKRRAGAQGEALEHAIRASFSELESTGTCAVLGGFQRSTFGVALPVRLGRDRTLMSLSCGKADVDFNLEAERDRIAPVLRDTAGRLEAHLAHCDSGL